MGTMSGLLLAQLSDVARRESDAIADRYAWPPRPPMPTEKLKECERLRIVASRLSYRAVCAGQTNQGLDALYGGPIFNEDDGILAFEGGQE